jgi:hypothetical protein
MRQTLLIIFILVTRKTYSQKLDVFTFDKSKVVVTLLDSVEKSQILTEYNGVQNNTLRKEWTARTFTLSDGRILLEFYDRQAIIINNLVDFKKLDLVVFVKNNISFLKRNISYKIKLSFDESIQILRDEKPKRLNQFKSEMPEYFDFEVYELSLGQIMYLDKSKNPSQPIIYSDLKTLCSEHSDQIEKVYGSEDEDYLMKKIASGDLLLDYEDNDHLIYPKYLKAVIKNHKLSLVEREVYVSEFFGNLYKSKDNYYILIDEINQKNGAGNKMRILNLYIYETLQQVKEAKERYETLKNKEGTSEHMYQKISNKYGENFPKFVPQLIEELPSILNFDKEQLSFDSLGVSIIDEALLWNISDDYFFEKWFPSILAYLGHCYIVNKKDGKWSMYLDKDGNVWVPEVKLKDGTSAWDWIDFYKDMYEGPMPLRFTGDW